MDYHNQLYFSKNGLLHKALQAFCVPSRESAIAAKFILAFKLKHTKWGKDRPADVERRFNNIQKIFQYRGG